MEKEIMSKTNDTSKLAVLEDHHTLADSELDAVSGGWFPFGIPGASVPQPQLPRPEGYTKYSDIELKR
jgi:hypothetical protein